MQFPFGSRLWCPLSAALWLAGGAACDDQASSSGDGGPDGSTDTDTDTDVDTDTDTDADGGPDGGSACEADPDRILGDISYLASPDMNGRETGSAENELAMEMAEDAFVGIGLAPIGDGGTYRQAFGIWGLTAEPSLSVDGGALVSETDYTVFGDSGSAAVTEEMVYVGYGMTVPAYDPLAYPDCPLPSTGYDDYAGVDVTGKIAIVVRHGPADDATVPATCPDDGLCGGTDCLWNFSYKAANADLHGAAAMIVVQNYGNGPAYLSNASVDPTYLADMASVFVDRDLIEAAVPSLETWTDGIDGALAPDPHATGIEATIDVAASDMAVATANVIGAIEGTDPDIGDEVVIVGGHIDHLVNCDGSGEVCPGADDNASGAAVTMELARLISSCANPARTIVFALWNGEEEGLLGSYHYLLNPVFPISSTIAAYSVDMVGAGDGSGVALYGTTEDQNAWLLQVMQGSATEMGFDWSAEAMVPIDSLGYGSDNVYFDYAGVPSAMTTTLGDHLYYHTPDDTVDTINPDDLEAAAAMMYAGLKPIVEGTEEIYLTSKMGAPRGYDPSALDFRERLVRNR
jgi:hypothetical protein